MVSWIKGLFTKKEKYGLMEQFYNNGNLHYSENYIDDEFDGIRERYSPNGLWR